MIRTIYQIVSHELIFLNIRHGLYSPPDFCIAPGAAMGEDERGREGPMLAGRKKNEHGDAGELYLPVERFEGEVGSIHFSLNHTCP